MSTPTALILDIKYDPIKIGKKILFKKTSDIVLLILLVFFTVIMSLWFIAPFPMYLPGVFFEIISILCFAGMINRYCSDKRYLSIAQEGKEYQLFKDRIEYWESNYFGASAIKRKIFLKDIKEISLSDYSIDVTLKNNTEKIFPLEELLSKNTDIRDGFQTAYDKEFKKTRTGYKLKL